jgi:F-type H+-transporting ATPase subunit b
MFSVDFTFVWTAVNLALVYFVVNKFLFKRLGAFMKSRAEGIAAEIKKGEDLAAQGEQALADAGKELSKAGEERKEILDDARKKANEEHDAIVEQAKKEAHGIVETAREQCERERVQMLDALRREVAALAVAAATKVIESNMDTAKNRELVSRFLDEEGAA